MTQKKNIKIIALYLFTNLDNYEFMQKPLKEFCVAREIMGTLIISEEGINGTVAGTEKNIDELIALLQRDERFTGLEWKTSWADEQPFYRMKVKVKKEIVTIGRNDADPREVVGQYVDAEKWNDLISDPEVILIDTRNDYEIELGTFQNAVNPNLDNFRQFPEYVKQNLDPKKHKKVAMFCTGGIRCEKASSFMLQNGFENVYHLKGGILKYLENVQKEQSMWDGECFVFDNRVAVDHDLKESNYTLCSGCRMPVSPKDRASEKYEDGVSCPRCFDELTPERAERLRERKHQIDLAKKRGEAHLGISTEQKRQQKLEQRERELEKAREKERLKKQKVSSS